MAKDINKFGEYLLSWEGGFVNDPTDAGGATNKGVTLNTLKAIHLDENHDGVVNINDLKALTNKDVIEKVLKPKFWDKMHADQINDEWVAYYIVDWFYNAGTWAAKRLQRVLGLTEDGIIGTGTISAINAQNPKVLLEKLINSRIDYYNAIVKSKPNQAKFIGGWTRRAKAIRYGSMVTNAGKVIS